MGKAWVLGRGGCGNKRIRDGTWEWTRGGVALKETGMSGDK